MQTTRYVQHQVNHLAKHQNEDILTGKLSWMPALGCSEADTGSMEATEMAKWREAKDENGRTYLYHIETKETKWA